MWTFELLTYISIGISCCGRPLAYLMPDIKMWCHWNKQRRCSVWIKEKWIHPSSPRLLIFRSRVNECSSLARTGGTTLILVQMYRATDYLLPWGSITKYLTHHLESVKAAQILPLTKFTECTGSSCQWYRQVSSDCEVRSNVWSLKALAIC